jgi:hypothetical protein
MDISINEFSPGLVLPQYQTTDFSPQLEVALLQKKQQTYNQVLSTVKGLKNQALNIQMLNLEGKKKLDSYNKDLDDMLSRDLGDLSDIDTQNKIAGYFSNLASDQGLIRASTLSKQYQSQLDLIDQYKRSGKKDQGYNSVNEYVFHNWNGGVRDFMTASLDEATSPGFKTINYTPFKELDTKMLNIAKTLHADKVVRQGASGTAGYMMYDEKGGVSPERIRLLMQSTFDQEDLEQLDVMAKYEVLRHKENGTTAEFHQKYSLYADREIKRTEGEADKARQLKSYYEGLMNQASTPADKKVEYAQMIKEAESNEAIYKDRAWQMTQSKKSPGDFNALGDEQLLEFAKEIQWNNKIEGISNSLAYKTDIEKYLPDDVAMFNRKMDVIQWQTSLRENGMNTRHRLSMESAAKAKKEGETPAWSGPGDTVKNKQSVIESFDSLREMQEQFGQQTNRIISSPSFDRSMLKPENYQAFLNKNKGNYEAQMWEVFKNTQDQAYVNGEPQVEKFKAWMSDQEKSPKSPYVQSLVDGQHRNELVSDYMDATVHSINTAVRAQTQEYETIAPYIRKSDGNQMTADEFYAGEVGYVAVPTIPKKPNETDAQYRARGGSYQNMPLDEAIQAAGPADATGSLDVVMGSLAGGPVVQGLDESKGLGEDIGQAVRNVFSRPGQAGGKTVRSTHPMHNDPGLAQALWAASQKSSGETTQRIMAERLPQLAQFGQVTALNDLAVHEVLGDVKGAAKNSNPKAQFAISKEDLDDVTVPFGAGQYGTFRIKPEAAKKFNDEGWKLPPADNPQGEPVAILPGQSYAFKTQAKAPYDVLYNEIIKTRPDVQYYRGYKIEISKGMVDGVTYAKLYNDKGQLVDSGSALVSDSKALITPLKKKVDTLAQ